MPFHKPTKAIQTAVEVDLARLNGDWYVIANIPTFIERQAFNAVESYRLGPNGRMHTTFAFNKGAYDGPRKTYHPTGFVTDDPSNAVWGMQFVWPFKAEYRIMHINPDYSELVIGRTKRDYVWLMVRTPQIPPQRQAELLSRLNEQGYDLKKAADGAAAMAGTSRIAHAYLNRLCWFHCPIGWGRVSHQIDTAIPVLPAKAGYQILVDRQQTPRLYRCYPRSRVRLPHRESRAYRSDFYQ